MISDGKFPKKERILKTGEYRKVRNYGKVFREEQFILTILSNSLNCNRLGIIVNARTIKRAHDRNRIKRLIRTIYRLTKNEMIKGFDLVVYVKDRETVKLSMDQLKAKLGSLLKKSKIIC